MDDRPKRRFDREFWIALVACLLVWTIVIALFLFVVVPAARVPTPEAPYPSYATIQPHH